ncbi:PilZ domain-containing protein [Desulfovibrio gilichinskyi]|uniref:PilZ domain-containing protein n=1 Tax=Desulfovibrio gilichinskyi TaxID=1519643 RepID=A0A1X7EW09_9BACT|nr:PilZ domain-containing protein [Desulfovibrio gilichinskyi]SMF41328.1 PilZ domain-containing protein [Desulfovibrio gilichinskyi]
MASNEKISIIAFVDSPEPYKKSKLISEFNIKYCSTLDNFIHEVLEEKFTGLILDIQKVMRTPAYARNRIFSVAANRSLIRTKVESDKVVFVDDLSNFKQCCIDSNCIMTRINERVKINIPIRISSENDPAMANSFAGIIQNISASGCFISTTADIFDQDFLHLKFTDLSNKLPIYAGIRWIKSTDDNMEGVGVKFITIEPEQFSELQQKYITPNLKSNDS